MNTSELTKPLATLFSELVDGAPSKNSYMLNTGDRGLLASLDALSASAASAVPVGGGASIAAHVDHLRYGLSLMNRWSTGENPFRDADWSQSWERGTVDDAGWTRRRAELRDEAERWLEVLRTPRDVSDVELTGMISTIAHLAYHVGAIRQIDRITRGPAAND